MDMYSARVHGPSRRGGRQDARETVVLTVLQRVVALQVVLLVVFSTAMDHGTEALRRF